MNTKKLTSKIICFCLLVSGGFALIPAARGQGTAFAYQGRLNNAGQPADGTYDLTSALFTAGTGGSQIGGTNTDAGVGVTNGLFTAVLDFGANFSGADRWLEITVRTNGGGGFTTVGPRQKLTPSPYAITAGNLNGVVSSGGLSGTYASPVILNNPANQFTGDGTGLTNVTATTLDGLGSSSFWQLNGNVGTTSGVNFLGTTDNQPLEVRVNGTRAMRVEPTVNDANHAGIVNVVDGSQVNVVAPGIYAATIAGGGAGNYYGFGYTNSIASDFGVIGGGRGNTIQIFAADSTIGGGQSNTIQTNAPASTIGGGSQCKIGTWALSCTIAGGDRNIIQDSATQCTIGGGQVNMIQTNASESTIAGGTDNKIQTDAFFSTIGGGTGNTIQTNTSSSTISGGMGNTIQAHAGTSAIAGGFFNMILTGAFESSIGGGFSNRITGIAGVVPGGDQNVASTNAFAAGHRAKANFQGDFVWADSTESDFAASGPDRFLVRASGGVTLYSSSNLVAGVDLPAGSGSWNSVSDRNAKENFRPVDAQRVLDAVAAMPLSTWNYKTQDKTIRRVRPMAQDFHAAFGIGENDTTISTVDEGGVALAAIQGLNQKLEETRAENAELKQELSELRRLVRQLHKQP